MKTIIRGVALVLGLGLAAARVCLADPRVGDVVFETGFEDPRVLQTWHVDKSDMASVEAGWKSDRSLLIAAPAGVTKSARAHLDLPVDKMAGVQVLCRAMIKAEAVTEPPKPWNGIKFMLHLKGPSGEQWLQQNNLSGTFDWKQVQFKAWIPRDAASAELILGLEAVNGQAQFDDIKVTVVREPRVRPATPPAGPVFTGHDEPRLRGAMIRTSISPESLTLLGHDWNANLIRWQLTRVGRDLSNLTPDEYEKWLESELRKLDTMLPICEKLGVRVVLDLHSPLGGVMTRGGYVGSDSGLFADREAQSRFVADWKRMAARYRESKVIWGYDLVNEPIEGDVAEGCDDWQALATRAAKAVRKVDAVHAIIVEPAPGGGPEALVNLVPLAVPGVVYSIHVYTPHEFTHQGVFGQLVGVRYPGFIAGKTWDKEQLRKTLQPVLEWQHDYGVQIYVGEFSAIRWAPDHSACRYLKDCIDLFEENGWDWSYHAFREWDGWSVEHGEDPNDKLPSRSPTDRELLLREWFAKNQKGR